MPVVELTWSACIVVHVLSTRGSCRLLPPPLDCHAMPDSSVIAWTLLVEAGVYIVAAVLMITSAQYAVVELR